MFISGVLQSIISRISVGSVVPTFMMIIEGQLHFIVQFFKWFSYSDFFYSRFSNLGWPGTLYVLEHNDLEQLIFQSDGITDVCHLTSQKPSF